MRTVALVCCTIAVLALPASAGDVATLELLGWSADGRYFALGNFGIQDPYTMRGRLTAILQTPARARVIHRETAWSERYNHRVHSIIIGPGGQTVAVILTAWSLGFEGPDVRYRGLAASLRTR